MTSNLIIVCLLTMVINTAETLSYSVRYAGVRLNKIAIALSLTGIIVLVSRTANMIQAPLTAKFVDVANKAAASGGSFPLLNYLQIIMLAASLGTLIAIGLFPTFVGLFGRIISKLEIEGSLPKVLSSVTVGQLKNTRKYIRKPKVGLVNFRYLGIPKRFIIMNIFVTGFYTVGVLSSLYAAHLLPQFSTTASQASGLINGMATIMLTVFIDPQLGIITHKATENVEYRDQLGKIYVLLMGSRFLGTLLGQLVLIPAAYLISWLVQLI
ncbi:DUF2837 domain-containing protein [Paenibacillus sp. PK3_47]|uniref:lipid II flippase Amj family protein n=1 Tax=Paenibacillus sp. PK3_47 TaxID=2072642 RepID=UPI00201E577F|nr:lipid II flippase Amj family protein [Paenibacillus sp. PK3_47]UQZ37666.1 DUF2837 domain-containing protein [Paenibacillus sp. PK3_47]